MSRFESAGDRSSGRASALGGWVVVVAGIATATYYSAATEPEPEPGAPPVETVRPHAQTARDVQGGSVWSLAFAPGDTRLASATVTGDVWLKDLATGRSTRVRTGPMSSARALAFSPDGRVLAVAGLGPEVWLWDLEAQTELDPLPLPEEKATHLAFSSSGDGARLAVGGGDRSVTVWDWRRRRHLATRAGNRGELSVLALSADGMRALSADPSRAMTLWDVDSGRVLASMPPHAPGTVVTSVAFATDGASLATAGVFDRNVRLWDTTSGTLRVALPETTAGVYALAFSPAGDLLAVARGDGIVTLWDVAKRREVGAVRVRTGSFQAVAFSGDGRTLATGGTDGSVRLWDVALAVRGPAPGGL
jgi:WD40 repeat protein